MNMLKARWSQESGYYAHSTIRKAVASSSFLLVMAFVIFPMIGKLVVLPVTINVLERNMKVIDNSAFVNAADSIEAGVTDLLADFPEAEYFALAPINETGVGEIKVATDDTPARLVIKHIAVDPASAQGLALEPTEPNVRLFVGNSKEDAAQVDLMLPVGFALQVHHDEEYPPGGYRMNMMYQPVDVEELMGRSSIRFILDGEVDLRTGELKREDARSITNIEAMERDGNSVK